MAKISSVEKNKRRKKLSKSLSGRRTRLKAQVTDMSLSPDERLQAMIKLSEVPRNSSKTRIRNRCGLTGRPRGYYRKFDLSRIALRELGSQGQIPGLVKSSW